MALEIENPVETAIGAAVLAVAVGFGVYATQAGGSTAAGADSYEVTAKFRKVNGLNAGADVRVAGVKVGRVVSIQLDPATYKALAVLSVDNSVELTEDAFASIDTEGLLGGTFVDLDPGGGVQTLVNGDEIINTQGSLSILELLQTFGGGGGEESK